MDEMKPGGHTSLDLRTAKPQPPVETPAVAFPSEGRLTRGTPLFSWEAPEYIVYEKSTVWYVGFGIVLALLLFSAFLLKSFLSGVVFALAGILVFLYSERTPRIINYELRDTGVRIGDRVYPFRELSGFNMVERGGIVYILFKSRRIIMPMVHVPVADNVDANAVRAMLLAYLPEDTEFTEPLADIIAHWLGF